MPTIVSDAVAKLIFKQENVNPSYNNPGAIMDLAYYRDTGKFRLQKYATLAEGWAATDREVQRRIDAGLTLREFFSGGTGDHGWIGGYAPASHAGNDPDVYAANVAAGLGIDPDKPIRDQVGVIEARFGGATTTPGSPGADVNPTHPPTKA